MSAPQSAELVELELRVSLGIMNLYFYETASPSRLEEWNKFTEGETNAIEEEEHGKRWRICIEEDLAKVDHYDGDTHIFVCIPDEVFRAEIRRQLPR